MKGNKISISNVGLPLTALIIIITKTRKDEGNVLLLMNIKSIILIFQTLIKLPDLTLTLYQTFAISMGFIKEREREITLLFALLCLHFIRVGCTFLQGCLSLLALGFKLMLFTNWSFLLFIQRATSHL